MREEKGRLGLWESAGRGPWALSCPFEYTACVSQSCPALCRPMDRSPPGSSIHGILQARILEWVAMPSSRGSSQSSDQTHVSNVSCIGRRVLYH